MERPTNKKAARREGTETESVEQAETAGIEGLASNPASETARDGAETNASTPNRGQSTYLVEGTALRGSEPSNTKLTLERVKAVRDELRSKGHSITQRNILKQLGGSFSTVSKLLHRLEVLESEPFDLTITVADATAAAIKADIQQHVEIYMNSIQDKLTKVEETKNDLIEAKQTIASQQETIADLLETITHLEIKIALLEGFNKAA